MSLRGWILAAGGAGFLGYILMSVFIPDEKKMKNLGGLDKRAVKVSHSNVIDLAATSDKPLYKLSKKEIEELLRTQSKK